ncbi:MAG: sulfotransferase [Candidatus Helarchaeota archaeon]|nr:sulfotransferase [Candidatus Helarchaeota archaeon]
MKKKTKKRVESYFPFPMAYAGFFVSKFFDTFKKVSFYLEKLETRSLSDEIDKLSIDRPIYITGLARAGTTIILEMLSKHPDVATHRYKHLLMPYIPHWLSQIVKKTNYYTKPTERVHKDGILVTRDSPEAVEEILWLNFFDNLYDENSSHVLGMNVSHPKFEKFYRNNILKLMFNERSNRYIAKNNYNVTRMEYLLQLFPSSKFLLIIRNPVNHIASLIKQTRLFLEMERVKPLLYKWSRVIGHREFGHRRVCVNVGNTDTIHKIRQLWRIKETYVKGWAYYWSSVYDFVANLLESNEKIKNATLLIRYEDLCGEPAKTIDMILGHIELSPEKFEAVKKYYVKNLHQPTYYSPDFSKQEIADIAEVTASTAARFGY